jgi:hypothetical protein
MNQLIQSNSVTMASTDLLVLVNSARTQADEKPIRHSDFYEKCIDELDGEHYGISVVQNLNKTETKVVTMTADQCKLVAMRESKAVRRAVLEKLNSLESQKTAVALPDFSNPAAAARAWADQVEAAQALEIERDQAVATKAEIGNRREATAMNTASQAVKKVHALEVQLDHSKEYCTIKRMEMLKHGQKFEWRRLKSTCTEMGIQAVDVFDQNYGTVKAYHVDVWREAYGIGLDD